MAAILFLAKVVGSESTAMDSKGNKVLVCDNGTGVSSICCYTARNALYLINSFVRLLFCSLSSVDLLGRTSQRTSSLRWWADRLLDQQRKWEILKLR